MWSWLVVDSGPTVDLLTRRLDSISCTDSADLQWLHPHWPNCFVKPTWADGPQNTQIWRRLKQIQIQKQFVGFFLFFFSASRVVLHNSQQTRTTSRPPNQLDSKIYCRTCKDYNRSLLSTCRVAFVSTESSAPALDRNRHHRFWHSIWNCVFPRQTTTTSILSKNKFSDMHPAQSKESFTSLGSAATTNSFASSFSPIFCRLSLWLQPDFNLWLVTVKKICVSKPQSSRSAWSKPSLSSNKQTKKKIITHKRKNNHHSVCRQQCECGFLMANVEKTEVHIIVQKILRQQQTFMQLLPFCHFYSSAVCCWQFCVDCVNTKAPQ